MASTMENSRYREEMYRVASFVSWPGEAEICTLTLARTGFCYTGSNFVVFCWCCEQEIDANVYGINMKQRHRIVAPDCPCLTNACSGNVPLKLPTDFNIQVRSATETDYDKQISDIKGIFKIVCRRAARLGVFEPNVLKLRLSEPNFDLLRRELVRLATFQHWPATNCVKPDALALAGFFYTGKGDSVCCAFCRKSCDQWKKEDEPRTMHKRLSPDCAFVRNNLGICANVPKEEDSLDEEVQLIGVNSSTYRIDQHAAEEPSPGRNSALEVQAVNCGTLSDCAQRSRHPDMIDVEVRKLSFYKTWSVIPKGQTPAMLAEAGFYYYGPSDYCKCFFCDGGLKNWQEDDEPWSEHARWYPRCEYVKNKKGSDFILGTQYAKSARLQEMQPRFAGTTGSQSTSSASPSVSSSENSNTARKQGATVQVAKPSYSAHQAPKADALPVIILQQTASKSKNKKKKKTSQSKTGNQSSSETQTVTAQEETEVLEVGEENPDDSMEVLDDMETSLLKENQLLKDARTCKVCMEKDVSVVFLPCGHLVCCQDCAPELRICAICRALIRGTVKTFLA